MKLSSKPRICLFGRHSNRIVLAYNPYKLLAHSSFQFTNNPFTADILFVGFALDLQESNEEVRRILTSNPSIKIIVLSEEPLWDTVYTPSIQAQLSDQLFCLRDYPHIKYSRIDYDHSDVFHYEAIPYFLTTSSDYIAKYIPLYHAALNKLANHSLVMETWQGKPSVFAAVDRRIDDNSHLVSSSGRLICLSKYRVQLIEAIRDRNIDISIVGRGWAANSKSKPIRRQDLPDWHLEKLLLLQRGFRFCFALENTHKTWYVSEKIFDSYASASIPLYYASPTHSVKKILKLKSFVDFHDFVQVDDGIALLDEINLHELRLKMIADIEMLLSLFKRKDVFQNEIEARLQRIVKVLT